jgi:hypothetical protein
MEEIKINKPIQKSESEKTSTISNMKSTITNYSLKRCSNDFYYTSFTEDTFLVNTRGLIPWTQNQFFSLTKFLSLMKKLFLVLLAVGLFASCQKKSTTPPANKMQAVSFGVNVMNPNSLKADGANVPDTIICSDVIPDMAWIQIDGNDYYAQLTTVDGKLYTQSIQLSPGSHSVDEFVLYKETDGVQGPTGSDPIVYGTPMAGSTFAIYVTNPLSFNFDVTAFEKTEVPVEVLCFSPNTYDSFGYDWFVIDRTVVREQCFFGDFCTKHYMEYEGSDYASQSTGLQLDMPAIFKIMAYVQNGESWDLIPGGNAGDGGFTNDTEAMNFGVGAPLCIKYADKLGVVDNYKFELYILVKQGDAFNFVLFHTWTFSDDAMISAGEDGVVDFELGNCNIGGADLVLPPYMNLPATATVKIGPAYAPSTAIGPDGQPGYFDVTLSNFGTGYDIVSGDTYAGFCAARDVTINLSSYSMNVYSSLYPDMMLATYAQDLPWNEINWLLNHLGDYPAHTWADVQHAIWTLEGDDDGSADGGVPARTPLAVQMAANAASLGASFVPAPGDLAAVLFESPNDNTNTVTLQLVIIQVDP